MESKDEMEIVSKYFEEKEDTDDCVLKIRKADQKARLIAETLTQLRIELNDILTNYDDAQKKELEVYRINKQMAELRKEYTDTVKQLSDFAKSVNFEVDNLKYQKFDIDQHTKENELLEPWIVVNDEDLKKPKLFNYEQRNNNSIGNADSFCSCDDESEENVRSGFVENPATQNCYELSKKLDTDYEKEAVRDDLMATMGEVKLLHQQNRDLLSQLNTTSQRTTVLSNALRDKPFNMGCQNSEKSLDTCQNTETKLDSEDLMCEVDRLRNELNEMKRDRCQIELARKILNISDSQCANCVGSTNQNDNDKIKLEELTDKFNCVLADRDIKSEEIANLRKKLDAAIQDSKTYKDCLVISKTRITQLERELFELKSVKSHDTEVIHSNDKYLIENLKHRLYEEKAKISKMQTLSDFHLHELEDKKAKYLEVLQIQQEQKNLIETLNKEKSKIAKEYEDEFKRMDTHLKARLEEIGTLPAKLAAVQRDFEKEKSARMILEEERNTLLNDNKSLKTSLALENNAGNDKTIKDLEEQKKQLNATVMNLKDNLKVNQRQYIERTHYALQLNDHLNAVREEAAIQVTKIKDFSECQKLKYTEYIQQLEKQLAESRAIACSEFKKRDHVDERLRNHIEILTKNLNEANIKIAEVANVKKLIENNSREELCKFPGILNSICHK